MPSKKKKTGKERLDKYYHLAKDSGYRARSAFKLIQLNKRYDFLAKSNIVLDLCAAPGGWCQVASKYCPPNALIIGVDLAPIKPIPKVSTMVGDITSLSTRNALAQKLGKQPADCVVHDGAPNVGKNWVFDAYSQSELTLHALRLATEFLRGGGIFVTKVFRSQDYNTLIWVFKQLFKKVDATKPAASRNQSAEIFVVCQGYLNPKKIDPRLLDPKWVFREPTNADSGQEVHGLTRLAQVTNPSKPNREGYNSTSMTLSNDVPVSSFIAAENPIQILAEARRLIFDQNSKSYLEHKETNEEIKALCSDLKVLSKKDFKVLLKWRRLVGDFIKQPLVKVEGSSAQVETIDVEQQKDDDLETQLRNIYSQRERTKKKLRQMQKKRQRKIDLGMLLVDDQPDSLIDTDVFNIKQLPQKFVKPVMFDNDANYIADEIADSDEEEPDYVDYELMAISDPEERYDRMIEKQLDSMYEDYLTKHGEAKLKHAQRKKLARVRERDRQQFENPNIPIGFGTGSYVPRVSGDLDEEGEDEEGEDSDELEFDEDVKAENPFIKEENPDFFETKENELVVTPALSKKEQSQLWFDQDIFQDIKDESEIGGLHKETKRRAAKPKDVSSDFGPQKKKSQRERAIESDSGEDEEEVDDKVKWAKVKKAKLEVVKQRQKQAEQTFEIVPQEWPQDDDDDDLFSSDDEDDHIRHEDENLDSSSDDELDEEMKVKAMAIGQAIVNDGKLRRDLEDSAYHRYAFNDSGLPGWFRDNEIDNTQRQIPLTKEQMEESRRRFFELNARPLRKVAEAQARKKIRRERKLSSLRKKAEEITHSDMNTAEKRRSIERLNAKLNRKETRAKKYIVARKGGVSNPTVKKGERVKKVDKRMRKDNRGLDARDKKLGRKRGTSRSLARQKITSFKMKDF